MSRESLRLAALVLVCYSITARLGSLDPVGLALLFGAIALMLISLSTQLDTPVPAPGWEVAIAALVVMTLRYPSNARDVYDPNVFRPLIAVALVAGVGGVAVRGRRRLELGMLAVLGAAQLTMVGVTVIRNWGRAPVDVFDVQQEASRALLHGGNPYTPLVDTLVGSGISPGTLTPTHFPYGPSIAILDLPARALGDVRLTHLAAAVALLAVLVVLARRTAPGRPLLISLLWLALPLTAGMVENGWVDIVTMAGFGGWLALRTRHPWWAAAVLGVALAAKPIFLPGLIPMCLWSRMARREVAFAGLTALLVILPFAVATGFGPLYVDVVGFHLGLGPRYDALTVASYLHLAGYQPLPVAVTVAVTLMVGAAGVVRRPRDLADLLTSGAVICTIALLLLKEAFFNYYFVPAVLLVMALAARQLPVDGGDGERGEQPEDQGHAPTASPAGRLLPS